MNKPLDIATGFSACPHDCPSTCALEVEIIEGNKIGRLRGAPSNSYTDGVICAKVARYAERVYHPDRLKKALKRKGNKGEGGWSEISFDDALDEIAEQFIRAEARLGSETVWPYFYAGTMGLVQRDSIQRLRHAKGYAGQFDTICVTMAWTGFAAGTGKLMGPDPRELAKSDCVVIWGTNAVTTQVNVMTHAIKARKARGAKIVVIDIYQNDTMKQADLALCLRPGSDGALACAVMHVLFRDGLANRQYMQQYTDDPAGFEAHLKSRTPEWAAAITGLSVAEIEEFAHLVGKTPRTYIRLGYGFTRSRNGAINMHAASSIASVTGSWLHEGGGAFHTNSAIYNLDQSLIKGDVSCDPDIRYLDQSRIGPVLTGDPFDLQDGPPITAMLVQNTNPASIAPEQAKVKAGLVRDDLFLAVHEQFMTETAEFADIVLPATMFLEHDDIYRGGGNQHIVYGPKQVEPPADCHSNIEVINGLAQRLGVGDMPGFNMSENQLIDDLLKRSNRGDLQSLQKDKWIDCQPDFDESHYVNGFAWPDGKFRFRPDWQTVPWGAPPNNKGLQGPHDQTPEFPDHWQVVEAANQTFPFRLATSPARSFLNSTFNNTPSSLNKEIRPTVKIHPDDAGKLGVKDGDLVRLVNQRGAVLLHAEIYAGVVPGVLISEGLFPNRAFQGGNGINTLTGADPVAPHGGAAFHDNHVAVERV